MHARRSIRTSARTQRGAAEEDRPRRRPYATPGSRLDQLMRQPDLFEPPRAPRYPIVLCHGLYGFDVRGPFMGYEYHYWSAASDVLQHRLGAPVLIFAVPPTGSIEKRAEKLHELLLRQNFPRGQPLNFVGHSMGGLDARYLISHIRPQEYTPLSLTTIATPHRGSPFMDWCNANIGIGLELINSMMQSARPNTVPDASPERAPFSLKSPLLSRAKHATEQSSLSWALSNVSSYLLSLFDQPAYAMLSTRYMTRLFNPTVQDDAGVRYFSIATRANAMPVWHPLWLPKLILDKAALTGTCGAEADGSYEAQNTPSAGNDGLVSITSARWGEFLGVMENWDHWDVRGPGGAKRLRPARPKPPPPEKKNDEARAPHVLARMWRSMYEWLPPKAKAQSMSSPSPSPSPSSTLPHMATSPHDDPEWDWYNAALSPYEDTTHKNPPDTTLPAAVYALLSVYEKGVDAHEESEVAKRIADWISSHLPASQQATPSTEKHDSKLLLEYLTSEHTHPKPPNAQRMSTALLGFFPFWAHAEQDVVSPSTPHDTFERFWAAICRNLYEQGF